MPTADREKWNSKYAAAGSVPANPHSWLTRHLALLPHGRALDVATGRGADAIELALHGWLVTAIDVSDVAIRLAQNTARSRGADVQWIVADIGTFTLPASHFDVVSVFHFLERRLAKPIIKSLRLGGMLLYETYTLDQQQIPGNHIRNTDHMLEPGELLAMFQGLRIRAYREVVLPDRAIASLVAERVDLQL